MGYFSLDELAEVTVLGGVPAVERDLYWKPKTLGEIRRRVVEGGGLASAAREPNRSTNKGKEKTMPDENGTEATRPDA